MWPPSNNKFTNRSESGGDLLKAAQVFPGPLFFSIHQSHVESMNRMKTFCVALLPLLVLVVGCGPKISKVSGTVKVDGEPTSNLIVAFTPLDGGTSAAATTDSSGNYTLSSNLGAGIPPGNYRVSITTEQTASGSTLPADEGSDSEAYAAQARGTDYEGMNEFKEKIPPQYNTQTTLEREVTSGSNVIDFEIETK